jgi:hypothetical protein
VLDDDDQRQRRGRIDRAFEDLGEDQLAEVLAFCWVGQGTYEASDWDEAIEEAAGAKAAARSIDELMDMPMLASVLEAGLAAFDSAATGSATSAKPAERIARERSHGPPR